ncbi:gene transfer agent family protein [Alsobacter sp. R-9]
MNQHVAFIGDGERTLRLTPNMIGELERKRGAGIGLIFRRLVSNEFALADVSETIRLGLIGGGTLPEDADALVKVYIAERPLAESYPLALSILERVWFGASGADPLDVQMVEEAKAMEDVLQAGASEGLL